MRWNANRAPVPRPRPRPCRVEAPASICTNVHNTRISQHGKFGPQMYHQTLSGSQCVTSYPPKLISNGIIPLHIYPIHIQVCATIYTCLLLFQYMYGNLHTRLTIFTHAYTHLHTYLQVFTHMYTLVAFMLQTRADLFKPDLQYDSRWTRRFKTTKAA